MKSDLLRKVDKLFPTNAGFMCIMTDGTVWLYDGGDSWRYRSKIPQHDPSEEVPSAIIG